MSSQPNYQQATRHPWPCWLFVLPLLVAYESGVLLLGGEHPEVLRNGADHWLRRGLFMVGLQAFWVPPALLAIVFAIWIWRRRYDPSCDLLGTLSGMVLESVAYAIGLWALSRAGAAARPIHSGHLGQCRPHPRSAPDIALHRSGYLRRSPIPTRPVHSSRWPIPLLGSPPLVSRVRGCRHLGHPLLRCPSPRALRPKI